MSKNLQAATGNIVHAPSDTDSRRFGHQPACTPVGTSGASFRRFYETNAKVVTCKKCIKKVAAAEAVTVVEAPVVETVEVEVEVVVEATETVEIITEVAETATTEAGNTFENIEIGQSFRMMGETFKRIEFPAHLAHLGTLYAKDEAKGFLSYWAQRTDGVGTVVVAMNNLEVERV